jgi:hypothetical protein
MSKLIEHAAYLEQDPNDQDSVFVVLKVGVKKAAIEAGAIEIAAKAKGWQETVDELPNPITAPEGIRLWLVQDSVSSLSSALKQSCLAPAIESANAQYETLIATML